MSVPIIGNRKFIPDLECLVNAKKYLAFRREHGRCPDVGGATCAILYFSSKIQEHIRRHVPSIEIIHLDARLHQKHGKSVLLCRCPIGAPGSAIVMEELAELGIDHFVSVGTAGALQDGCRPGDIIICNRAYRDEGTSHHYTPDGEYFDADARPLAKLAAGLDKRSLKYFTGPTWTTDAPYAVTPEDVKYFQGQGVMTVEMEAAAFMAVAQVRRLQFAAAFVVSDLLTPKGWTPHFHDEIVGKKLFKLLEAAIDTFVASSPQP